MAVSVDLETNNLTNKNDAVNVETSPVSEIHFENKPELIWENMQMIAFNNKIFLNLK